ncbi:VWA domain-containing protein [Riemerella anatipestifer]|uniref:vWA domain-containing protein n=1 Tax=Riemerella anatipestifer TaxID=34085 RepID=UPI001AD6288B|nr:VWA domain-containing protein [Riemerella anatipestifer]MBO4234407.1 VWA domain-containing protein [Riemerella anatipestifer]
MFNFEFHSPWFLLLFLGFIPLIFRDLSHKKRKGVAVSSTKNMQVISYFGAVLWLLRVFKYIILSALILAIARPRTFSISEDRDETKGMDIVLSIDVSLSMLAKDLEPDRLTALKEIARTFIKQRTTDRIGLVEYSGEALMRVPLTSDHRVVEEELMSFNPMDLEGGTNIGDGLAVAVSHLRKSKAKSKIIILMTDGVNTIDNAMSPLTAAELARNNDIKVYTIGIGSNGLALMPTQQDIFGNLVFTEEQVKIDEYLLRDVAQITEGKYFRATSNESLRQIYEEIDTLEKSNIKTSKIYNYQEYFRWLLWIALVTLVLDALLRWKVFRVLN